MRLGRIVPRGRLRRRLTIAFMLAAGLSAAALAAGSYLLVRDSRLDDSLDRSLEQARATLVLAATILNGLITLDRRVPLRAVDFRDERADRRPTPALTDERFYAVLHTGTWKIDLTFWLHVVPRPHVTEALRLKNATADQKREILRRKDADPDRDSSAIYAAVLGA